ncbi:hypothetical protein R83H12_01998 [Fibrobacteria bacterium R8-3-H12]
MRKILFVAVFAIFASTQAFAIFGIGAHYVTNLGTLKGETEPINLGTLTGIDEVNLKREKASVLQGLGFKVWLDVLPLIDIEATFNMAATRYNTSLELVTAKVNGVGGEIEVPLEYKPEAPYNMLFDKASPIFGLFSGDASITYPFDVLPIIRPYVGLGVSYMGSLPIVNKKFAEDMSPALTAILQQDPSDPETSSKITKAFSDAITKADYKLGLGGHAIVGVRAKPPIIPLAVYANTKYYFGGNIDKKFSQGFVFELGGGFAL